MRIIKWVEYNTEIIHRIQGNIIIVRLIVSSVSQILYE